VLAGGEIFYGLIIFRGISGQWTASGAASNRVTASERFTIRTLEPLCGHGAVPWAGWCITAVSGRTPYLVCGGGYRLIGDGGVCTRARGSLIHCVKLDFERRSG